MDLKQLKYFVAVAELGSFAKAAELLKVAQPTLSRQVRALEIELKTSLFHRNGRGVLITPLGARFLEQAHGILHAADASLQVLQGNDRRLSGRVVCGMTPSVAQCMMLEYVRLFRQVLPAATLSISTHLSTALHDQLRASRLDFAILHDATPSPAVDITKLATQSLFVVGTTQLGPNKSTVSMRALSKVPLVLPSESHAVRKKVELAAARAGIALDVRLEVDWLDALYELVAQGVGHTISTALGTRAAIKSRKRLVIQKISPGVESDVSLVTPAQRGLTPLQERAIDIARETFHAVLPRGLS